MLLTKLKLSVSQLRLDLTKLYYHKCTGKKKRNIIYVTSGYNKKYENL